MCHTLFTTVVATALALVPAGVWAQYQVTGAPASASWPIFPPPRDDSIHSGAMAGGHCGGYASGCGDYVCEDVCFPRVHQVKEETTCWNVKDEQVCVPAVTFPWEAGGAKLKFLPWAEGHEHGGTRCDACGEQLDVCTCYPQPVKCGKVRRVRTLEQETYEVTRCRCEWEIRRLPPCGAPACGDSAALDAAATGSSPRVGSR